MVLTDCDLSRHDDESCGSEEFVYWHLSVRHGTSSSPNNVMKFCCILPILMFAHAAGLVTMGEGHAKAGEYKRIPVQIGQPASSELAILRQAAKGRKKR